MNTLFPPLICILWFSTEVTNISLCPKWEFMSKKKKGGGGGEQAAKIKEKFPDQINKLYLLNKELGR